MGSRSVPATAFSDLLSELHAAATPGPWELDIQSEGGWEYGNPTSVGGIVAPDPSPLPEDKGIAPGVHVVRFDDDYGTDQGADAHLIVFLRNHAETILALVKAVDDLKLVYDTSTDPGPILVCWQQLKEKRAGLNA